MTKERQYHDSKVPRQLRPATRIATRQPDVHVAGSMVKAKHDGSRAGMTVVRW